MLFAVYDIQCPVRGSTLNATMRLLCAVVRGIVQRNNLFVLNLQMDAEQVSRLVELEDIAKNKCVVTRTERRERAGIKVDEELVSVDVTFPVLELKPHCEYL